LQVGEQCLEIRPAAQRVEVRKRYDQAGQLEKPKGWLTKSAVIFPPAKKLLAEVEKKIAAQK
jgi:hypothetical protein